SAPSRLAVTDGRSPSVPPPNAPMSAPAEKARPLPETTTTFTSACSSNQAAASISSCSVAVLSGFNLSGRLSARRPRAPSAETSIVWKAMPEICIRCGMETDLNQVLGELTLEEKVGLLAGTDLWHIPAIPRVGLAALKMS